MSDNLYALLIGNADPEALFLKPDGGAPLTYGDFDARSARFANAICDLGVRPGDRVAVQAEKHADCLALYAACLRAGAVYLPLNPAYTPAEIDYFVRDAEPALFVAETTRIAEAKPRLRESGVRVVETMDATGGGTLQRRAECALTRFDIRPVGSDALAAILYTSGTTGRAKGAMLTHDNLGSNAAALVETWRFTAADVLLHALPIFHTHGLFVATNTVMLAGAAMLFLPRFDLDRIAALLPEATTMMGVPTFYARMLSRADFGRDLAAHMRLFVSGSAPLSPETHREFAARTGHAILERYGMTETSMITSNPYEGERRPGSVGFALPGVAVRIADPASGAPLVAGEAGVVEVKGPNVLAGYWRNDLKTQEAFRDGWFVTGDLGRLDSEGRLTIVGRDKDLIISGGLNVYPAEVEAVLDACEGVAESAVIGVPHPDFGEGVVAVIAPRPGMPFDEAAIRAEVGARLAAYKRPKRIVAVEVLPRNAMGKVQKAELRERYAALFANERQEPTAPARS